MSANDLGVAIGYSDGGSTVGTIENSNKEAPGYTETALNKIAIEFSRVAKIVQKELDQDTGNTLKIQTDYTIYDLLSPEPLEDKRVEKVVFPIPPGTGPAGTLNYLIESDTFFNDFHTVNEITAHCNNYRGAAWPYGNFSGLCFRRWKQGKFIRLEEGNDPIYYKNSVKVAPNGD